MSLPDITQLSQIIRDIARQELLPRFADVGREHKLDGSIVTVADRAMQESLFNALQQAWPDYAMLGEEMSSAEQAELMRNHQHGLWIVDPLDGTSNFTAGIPFFSVSVALLVDGEPVVGVVYDPSRDECFAATKDGSMTVNGKPFQPAAVPDSLSRCIGAIDYKRLSPELAKRLAMEPPYSSQRSFGSVALDWCWVAAGRFHLYLHGKQKLWDYAAGHVILSEAGGYSCTLDGEQVFNGTDEPRSALASLDPELFRQWRTWLAV